MKIKLKSTDIVKEISFNDWRGYPNKFSYEILERGETYYLRDLSKKNQIRYLWEVDYEHAIRILDKHPKKYDLIPISKLPFKIMCWHILKELETKESYVYDLKQLFEEMNLVYNDQRVRLIADYLSSNGLAIIKSHKDGGQINLTFEGKDFVEKNQTLTVERDEALIEINIESNSKGDQKTVFISYSWDNDEHQDKVVSFCNFLRERGYSADIDLKKMQENTSIDFRRLMHTSITSYDKIIIVLSEGYKSKAESFNGGVGEEYGLIIKDIEEHPQKYILVSFIGFNKNIYPLKLLGRDTVDLSSKEQLKRLYQKLEDFNEITFSDIGKRDTQLKKKEIKPFEDYFE